MIIYPRKPEEIVLEKKETIKEEKLISKKEKVEDIIKEENPVVIKKKTKNIVLDENIYN